MYAGVELGGGSTQVGRVTVQTVPRPSELVISIVPPWALTMLWAMLSPSPVPPSVRVRALSTR